MSKKITVGIFPNDKQIKSIKTHNVEPHNQSLMLDIWNQVSQKLKNKGYTFDYKYISNYDYNHSIKDIEKNRFDIIIGDFSPSNYYKKNVEFTNIIATTTPIIVYDPDDNHMNILRYIRYLITIWIKPLIILIILSIILSLLYYKGDKKRGFVKSLYYTIAGLFGQTGGILSATSINKNYSIITAILLFFVIYFFSVFITASTTAKSVNYFKKSYKINRTIQNMRILTHSGNNVLELKRNNAVPVLLPNNEKDINNYYLDNKKRLKLDGFIILPLNKIIEKTQKEHLNISELIMNYYHIAFPVNNKKKKLLMDINEEINILRNNRDLYNICNIWCNKEYTMC